MSTENFKCPVCGSNKTTMKNVHNYQYRTPMGIVTIDGDVKFNSCKECNEVLIPGKLIDSWNLQILEQFAKRPSIFSPEEMKFVFSVLPFSQNEIAEATGKDRSTLTRYKNGENPVDRLFDDTLKSVIADFLKGNRKTLDRLVSRTAFMPASESIKRLKIG